MSDLSHLRLISLRSMNMVSFGLYPEFLPIGSAFFPIVIGLASSFTHCAGMCAPIHFFMASKGKAGKWIWLYHGGRILGYGILGLLIGILGHFFSSLTSPTFRISAGIILAILYLFLD